MRLKRGNVERIVETDEQIKRLKKAGFKEVETANTKKTADSEQEETEEQGEENEKLDNMSVTELRDLAKEKGLKGYSSLSKEELTAVLKDVVE